MQLGIGRNIALFYMCVCVCTAVTSCQTKLRGEAPNPFVALYLVLYSVYDFVSVAERNFMLSIFFITQGDLDCEYIFTLCRISAHQVFVFVLISFNGYTLSCLTSVTDMIILASSDFIRMGSLLVSFFVEGVSCQFVLTIIFKHSTHTLRV